MLIYYRALVICDNLVYHMLNVTIPMHLLDRQVCHSELFVKLLPNLQALMQICDRCNKLLSLMTAQLDCVRWLATFLRILAYVARSKRRMCVSLQPISSIFPLLLILV